MRAATAITVLAALTLTLAGAPARAAEGNFLVQCNPDPAGLRVADPIGGADHVHAFAGVPGISDTTTPFQALTGGTTCQVGGETAGVWHPAIQKTNGTQVGFDSVTIYYRNPPGPPTKVMPFPFGLKHVHGNPDNRDPNHYAAIWRCYGSGSSTVYIPSSCPPPLSGALQEDMFFAQCWDGLSLDETNDGLAHHTLTGCDAAHPIKLPAINMTFYWPAGTAGGCLTSDIEHGTPCGLGSHADYAFWLNPFFFTKIVERCLNAGIQCRRGNGASGTRVGNIYQFGTPSNEVLTPAEAAGW